MDITNDWWPKFSAAEYERRHRLLREAMAARNIDCLLIYGTPITFGTEPGCPNLIYLSSFAPATLGYVVFPREGDPTLLIYNRSHLSTARAFSVIPDIRAGTDIEWIAVKRLHELGYERGKIGIVGNIGYVKASIPVEHHQTFTEQLPGATFEVVTQWYEDTRLVKSAEEIGFMEAGAAICDRAHEAFRDLVKAGVTDSALQMEVFRVIHSLGGRPPFGHVCSTPMHNPSMIYPTFYSLNRAVQWGDAVMTEIAAGYGGYFGKIMGTLFVGKPTEEYRLAFELAAEIYREVSAAIKPGMRGGDLQPLLGGRAAKHGFKSLSFVDGWSTYNTRPTLMPLRAEDADLTLELQPNLCLKVVGWVVNPDERMGVWLCTAGVVTETGYRSFHSYPVDSLEYATLDRQTGTSLNGG